MFVIFTLALWSEYEYLLNILMIEEMVSLLSIHSLAFIVYHTNKMKERMWQLALIKDRLPQ